MRFNFLSKIHISERISSVPKSGKIPRVNINGTIERSGLMGESEVVGE